jgi:hypothetical protein
MIGNVHNSYVRGNSVHQSFNRAVTIHGSNFLRVEKNVVYNAMGHNIFIEDAVERHNQIHDNLVMMTKRSMSLLNTDQTPASFWITNPDNDFTGNHAAGSDRYSYWFDLQEHGMGANANENICPINEKLGRFDDNVAHSNGRYGLRIFHGLLPRTYPCRPIVRDDSNPSDPYHQNPLITANFNRLTAWKNKRNGAIAESVADVRFNDFKVADNLLAGIEYSINGFVGPSQGNYQNGDNLPSIHAALVIGRTANTEDLLDWGKPHGIITPRREWFYVDGAKFYNYDWNDAAAFGTCSHCFHPAATDSGARTTEVRNLYFDATCTKKIRYQFPGLNIFHDLTGELTGLGPNSWATGHHKHNEDAPECSVDLAVLDGIKCDSTVQVRRLAFHNYQKRLELDGMVMRIINWDDDVLAAQSDIEAYKLDGSNYGQIEFKPKTNPASSWTFGLVTGHKYKIHWGNTGIDFE